MKKKSPNLIEGCCGSVGPKRKIKISRIPDNPAIRNGVQMIYIGTGVAKVKGKVSKNTYYASDHRRYFLVNEKDVNGILNHKEFILIED